MYYFDWTATSPMGQEAINTYILTAQNIIGNPSSTHPLGNTAAQTLEEARNTCASLLKVPRDTIYFTSGGTEGDSIVLQSLLNNPVPGEIIVSAIEHSAILENKTILEKSGWKFTTLPCPNGYLEPQTLQKALNPKVRMVSFMKVNNVTGTILDTKAFVKIVRDYSKTIERPIHIHCDAVQALGKIDLNLKEEDFDSAAFSSHKFCGPKGVGILYNKNKNLKNLSKGGGQEKGLRGGTENLPAICAMATALSIAIKDKDEVYKKVLSYRKDIEESALEGGFSLISPSINSNKAFSPFIITLSVKPLPSEVFIRVMGDKGFCLSAGSACSSNSRGKAESVLAAMNVEPKDRMSSIRISMGSGTTKEEVQLLCTTLKTIKKELGYGK
ncbi:MAG: cysteine desulfurase [Sphaerochaetaceae bacterium]|nr:cysteine desulfurase [Sphaerochaetaceae bacterium]